MDHRTRKSLRFNLVAAMVCVATLSIAASLIAPHYARHVFRQRQGECVVALRDLWMAERTYFERHGRYTMDLRELDWRPGKTPRYLYGFRTVVAGLVITSAVPAHLCPSDEPSCFSNEKMTMADEVPLTVDQLPETHFDAAQGFRIGCVGNVDSDQGIDQWSIDENGSLMHNFDDIEE